MSQGSEEEHVLKGKERMWMPFCTKSICRQKTHTVVYLQYKDRYISFWKKEEW